MSDPYDVLVHPRCPMSPIEEARFVATVVRERTLAGIGQRARRAELDELARTMARLLVDAGVPMPMITQHIRRSREAALVHPDIEAILAGRCDA